MNARGVADLFEEGIALFNAGRFFACHEIWEEAWKRTRGEERLFYQGLIQAAAALLHVERGNLRGAESLLHKSKGKLEAFPSMHMGLDVGEFRAALQLFFVHTRVGETPPWPRLHRV
ncbi:MAG: DUF309 domain-containing protein [Candidatus Binataceae bacterium]